MSYRALDLELMQTLVCVARERSFTKAAHRLNLTQQSISAQVARLEAMVGRRLLTRTPQGVEITNDGEALLLYARQMQAVSLQIRHHFSPAPLVGTVRLGILEGFASTGLPFVLGQLRQAQPKLELFAETGKTELLMQRFQAGDLDLVLGGQREGDGRGQVLWRDKLSWVGDYDLLSGPDAPVPLAMLPAPTQLRDVTLAALHLAGRSWTIYFESDNRASLRAAVLARLGLTVFCKGFMADEAVPLPTVGDDLLPDLGNAEFFLASRHDELVETVAEVIRSATPSLFQAEDPVAF